MDWVDPLIMITLVKLTFKNIDDNTIISSPFTMIYDHSKKFRVLEVDIKEKSFDVIQILRKNTHGGKANLYHAP